MAIEVTDAIEISRPTDAVFAFLDAPANYPKWVKSAKSVKSTGPDSFEVRIGLFSSMRGRVVSREGAKRHIVQLLDKHYVVDQEFVLTPSGQGTRVAYTRRMSCTEGDFGPAAKMVEKGTVKAMKYELTRLKQLLEA